MNENSTSSYIVIFFTYKSTAKQQNKRKIGSVTTKKKTKQKTVDLVKRIVPRGGPPLRGGLARGVKQVSFELTLT